MRIDFIGCVVALFWAVARAVAATVTMALPAALHVRGQSRIDLEIDTYFLNADSSTAPGVADYDAAKAMAATRESVVLTKETRSAINFTFNLKIMVTFFQVGFGLEVGLASCCACV